MWRHDAEWDEEDDVALDRMSSTSSCSGSSRSQYSVEPDSCPWIQHEQMVETTFGEVRVTVCGEASCPALLTYHDIGLNHSTCFQGLLLCEETSSLLLQNFCIFHIDVPGHEAGASEMGPEDPFLSAEDLADQGAEVAAHFGLRDLTCLGVTAGAYIVTLMAIRHPRLVKGVVLVSPVCRGPTWAEWANTKIMMTTLSFYGMARHVKDYLLERYLCQDQHGYHGPGSDALLSFRGELDDKDPESVMRYMRAMHLRRDLTELLPKLKAHALIVVGALSPFLEEAVHMVHHMDHRRTRYLEVDACGSLVTEERPQAMQVALRSFFKHVLPTLSPTKPFSSPSRFSISPSRRGPLPGLISPSSVSNASDPPSPTASCSSSSSSEAKRGVISRCSAAVAFEDLSLAQLQKNLKPIRTSCPIYDSDCDRSTGCSSDLIFVPTLSSISRDSPPALSAAQHPLDSELFLPGICDSA